MAGRGTAQAAFREVGVRVFLAALTIVLGFSSFIIGSYLTAIRDFGLFASIGCCFSLLVSMMFVPASPGDHQAREGRAPPPPCTAGRRTDRCRGP